MFLSVIGELYIQPAAVLKESITFPKPLLPSLWVSNAGLAGHGFAIRVWWLTDLRDI